MGKYSARRPLWRRIIALAAAYAIALSGLIASFGLARAAAEPSEPAGILCHTTVDGQSAPAPEDRGSTTCAASCCIGCLMLMAAMPPAPAEFIAVAETESRTAERFEAIVLAGGPQAKSHQSRAPPPTA